MLTFEDFMRKLLQLPFDELDGKRLVASNGWAVSYSIKFLTDPPHNSDYPVQIVIRVEKDGEHVTTWGCISNEQNRAFVNFYEVAQTNALRERMRKDDEIQREAKKQFEAL